MGIVFGSTWFHAELPSILNGDSTKGYVYSPGTLSPVAEELDHYLPVPTSLDKYGGYVVFKAIKPHWFLYKRRN